MVSNYAQLLAQRFRGRLDPEADEMIGYLISGAHRMRDLINAVLEFSRATAAPLQRTVIGTNQALAAAQANLSAAMKEQKAVVEAEPLPVVEADGAQLARVLQNLLSNALKYRSTSPPVITVQARRDGGYRV